MEAGVSMRLWRGLQVVWFLVVLVLMPQAGFAALRISFSVDGASWRATNIVLVETTPIDGAFDVVESWKGDVVAGIRIVIPELIPAAGAVAISRYPKGWPGAMDVVTQIPRQPVGSQMVLFLKRKEVPGETKGLEWTGWEPRDTEAMKISTVWVDGGETYIFEQQWTTSEPLSLGPLRVFSKEEPRGVAQTLEDLKRGVAEVLRVQEEMKAAVAEQDGRTRALRLKPFVHSKFYSARIYAIEELGKAGPPAMGVLGEMLDDPAYSEENRELVHAMVKAGGTAVGPELIRRLEKDLAFWSARGPSLSMNWWNEDSGPSSPLRDRYGQTYQLVGGLVEINYAAGLNTVVELRDLFRSLPQLSEIGDGQVAEECDKLIAMT